MEITSLILSPDRSAFVLQLNNAAAVTGLYLYTKNTYKQDHLKIDLSAKLTGQASQTITITPADISETEFDGLYFLDVVEPGNSKCIMAADLFRYERCVLDVILNTNECEECPDEAYMPAINMFMSLRGIEISVRHNLVQEALTAIYALDKYCGECSTCGKYKKV